MEWVAPARHPQAHDIPPLYDQAADRLTQGLTGVAPLPPPTITPVLVDPLERLDLWSAPAGPPLFGRLIVWQIATGLSLALAIAAALVTFVPHGTAPMRSVAAIGVVNAPAPLYLAEIDSAAVLRLTALATITVPNGRDLQLWIIPQGDQSAISLGVLPARGTIVALASVPAEGTRFVISMEPRGGTTAGRITGQVLYGGTLANR
jgi:anti-sigma-K factor RskA